MLEVGKIVKWVRIFFLELRGFECRLNIIWIIGVVIWVCKFSIVERIRDVEVIG